jgi:hypothetical protein
MGQGSKGPSQGQEISNSEDSELDDVEVQSSSDEVNVVAPPLTLEELAKKGYTEPSSEEDEPIRARSRPRVRIQIEAPTEKLGAINAKSDTKAHKPPAARPKQYREIVIVGVPQTTDEHEVETQTGACKARRISKRLEGQLIKTSAVVLSYEGEQPIIVFVDQQRFKTRTYIRQATRCYRYQGYNHLQSRFTKAFRCA